MDSMFYQPDKGWVGDLIPFSYHGEFYLYYLHDERIGKTADDYGFGTTWNLLITKDGTDIRDMGVVLPTGGYDDNDLSCYTGSVIADPNGRFHMFYTAQNAQNPKYWLDGKQIQYIMHATSDDLLHWEKHYESTFCATGDIYEPFDWRDPYVYYSEQESCYHMLLAARLKNSPAKTGGCIALCKSEDLWHWSIEEPFYAPHAFMTHECPDLFQMGEWWYLVFSTFSERFITHYRISRSPSGPWTAPTEDSFDGRAFYAAKTAAIDGERWAFAWVPSRRGERDEGQWEWAGALAMHKLGQRDNGQLITSIPPRYIHAFSNTLAIMDADEQPIASDQPLTLDASCGAASLNLTGLPKQCMIEAEIKYTSEIRSFGVAIRQDAFYEDGYFFRVEPFYNRIVFDLWPRRKPGVNQWYLDGDKAFLPELERPYRLQDKQTVHMRLLIDGNICTCYLDDAVALTTRIYNLHGKGWSIFARDGSITVSNLKLFIQNSHHL